MQMCSTFIVFRPKTQERKQTNKHFTAYSKSIRTNV